MNTSFQSKASWTLLVLILMQFVPLNRINSRVTAQHEFNGSLNGSAQQLLKKACYECHSNETQWPRLAYIAPASWVISSTVSSGRTALNFSTWQSYKTQEKKRLRKKIEQVVLEGTAHQPLFYVWNTTAQLTSREKQLMLQWLE